MVHNRANFLLVRLLQRSVQGKSDRMGKPQLRQIQHVQNIGKQTVDAIVRIPKQFNKNGAGNKLHEQINGHAQHTEARVLYRFCNP